MNTRQTGQTQPTGTLVARIERNLDALDGTPVAKIGYAYKMKNWLQHKHRDVPQQIALALLGRISGVLTLRSRMDAQVYRVDWSKLAPWQALTLQDLLRANTPFGMLPAHFGGLVLDYGLLSRRMVTDTGVGYIVDSFANGVEPENMKHHGLGTGAGAEAVGNTALSTEIAANHYTGSARPIGTTEEGASANIYKTVATHTHATAGDSITEHGIFSSATQGAGVLLDKHLFTAVALAVADSFQTTYQLTLSSGG